MLGRLIAALTGRRELREAPDGSHEKPIAQLRAEAAVAAERGRHAEVIALLERAVSRAGASADLLLDLGIAHSRAGDYERAHAAYCAALALRPGFPVALDAQLGAAFARTRLDPRPTSAQEPELPPPPRDRLVSVVVCSIDRGKFERVVADFHDRLDSVPHEIVGIHDARSLCEGYNRGSEQSRGDIVVFSHDDIRIVSPDFAAKLFASLERCDIVGVAGTTRLRCAEWNRSGWPHLAGQVMHLQPGIGWVVSVYGLHDRLVAGAQALDGLFFAVRREVLGRLQFDEATFDGWHFYDADFTYSAFQAGLRLGIRTDLLLRHDSRGRFDESYRRYAARFLRKHGAQLAGEDGGVDPQRRGLPVASEEDWILLTRHAYAA